MQHACINLLQSLPCIALQVWYYQCPKALFVQYLHLTPGFGENTEVFVSFTRHHQYKCATLLSCYAYQPMQCPLTVPRRRATLLLFPVQPCYVPDIGYYRNVLATALKAGCVSNAVAGILG